MQQNNLRHCNWTLNDNKGGASQLKKGAPTDAQWSDADLTESGLFVKDVILHWRDEVFTGVETTSPLLAEKAPSSSD